MRPQTMSRHLSVKQEGFVRVWCNRVFGAYLGLGMGVWLCVAGAACVADPRGRIEAKSSDACKLENRAWGFTSGSQAGPQNTEWTVSYTLHAEAGTENLFIRVDALNAIKGQRSVWIAGRMYPAGGSVWGVRFPNGSSSQLKVKRNGANYTVEHSSVQAPEGTKQYFEAGGTIACADLEKQSLDLDGWLVALDPSVTPIL